MSHLLVCDQGVTVIKDSYESRNKLTSQLFLEALKLARICRPFSVPVDTLDGITEYATSPLFAFSKLRKNRDDRTVLIPDFVFNAWPEVGIRNYSSLCEEMITRSLTSPQRSELFWIGNTGTHHTRDTLLEIAQTDKRIKAVNMQWTRGDGPMLKPLYNYVSLPEHCDFKYLIDLQGAGYSGRLKILLFSGRPVFIQDREWIQYFSADLKAWEHYIPVSESLDDLTKRLDWAEENETEAIQIGLNGQRFAMNNLTKSCAIKRIVECLEQIQDEVR